MFNGTDDVSTAAAVQAASSFDRATVEAVVAVAERAPSIHNTQPWRWELRPEGLLLLADRARQLSVADPDGHSLLISCGAALALTELALQAAGWQVDAVRFPEPDDPDVLARFTPVARAEPDREITEQVDAALARFSDRRPFSSEELSADAVESIRAATDGDGVHVDFPMHPDQRVDLAVAVSWADRVERDDDEYIAEMKRWLRDPDVHSQDGVPIDVVPHVTAGHPRHTDVPLRDFEVGVTGRQLIISDVDERPLVAVILTAADLPADQLAAGEAMIRLMIRAHLLGLASCPLSQAVDLVAFRTRVKTLMGWQGLPQMMLRVGHPTQPAGVQPRTPRRAVSDVLLDVLAN